MLIIIVITALENYPIFQYNYSTNQFILDPKIICDKNYIVCQLLFYLFIEYNSLSKYCVQESVYH